MRRYWLYRRINHVETPSLPAFVAVDDGRAGEPGDPGRGGPAALRHLLQLHPRLLRRQLPGRRLPTVVGRRGDLRVQLLLRGGVLKGGGGARWGVCTRRATPFPTPSTTRAIRP